ncbi:MAG: hypothetical protein ACOX5R_14170 [bacterium]|jgi:capsular polysaccharide biosynthesis protein
MIQEREININAIFQVLYDRGKKILIYTFAAMLLGAIASLFIHNRYGATATMYINVSKIGTHMIGKSQFDFETYQNMIPDKSTLRELMRMYRLDEEPFNLKHTKDLEKRIEIDSFDENAQLYTIYVELEDATTAARVANDLADEVIRVTEKIRNVEAESSVEMLEDNLNKVVDRVAAARNVYVEKLTSNLKPLLIAEITTKQTLLANKRQEVDDLKTSILENETRMPLYEEALFHGDLKKIITLKRSVVDDPVILEEIRDASGQVDLESIKDIDLYIEQLDSTYIMLESEYTKAKIDLAALKKRLEETEKEIKTLEQQLAEQQRELFIMETDEMIAKADFDRQLEVMSGVDKQVGWAGTTVTTERLDVINLYPAIPDGKKVYPRRSLMVALVGIVAFLMSLMYFIMTDIYGLIKTRIVEPS